MYDMARKGDIIGAPLIKNSYDQARTGIEQSTSNRISRVGGDILSQVSSMGGTPGSGMITGLQERATQPILASGQSALSNLSAQEMQQLTNMLIQQLTTGLSGLSKSSTAGDILGGLTTLGNIGLGGIGLLAGL